MVEIKFFLSGRGIYICPVCQVYWSYPMILKEKDLEKILRSSTFGIFAEVGAGAD